MKKLIISLAATLLIGVAHANPASQEPTIITITGYEQVDPNDWWTVEFKEAEVEAYETHKKTGRIMPQGAADAPSGSTVLRADCPDWADDFYSTFCW